MPSLPFYLVPALLAASAVGSYHCFEFFVPITVTAPSHELNFPPFQNHIESVALLLDTQSWDYTGPASLFKGVTNVTETFSINAQYCMPSWKSPTSVQLLTHGLGVDRTYWDFGGPGSQYNYIQVATAAGYATLAWDRIGNGQSSKPDPYNIVQAPIELAVLTALTEKLRDGTIHQDVPKPKTLVHVGHSWGSQLTAALASTAPDMTDGIVLTGFSTNATWQPLPALASLWNLAKENQPERFGDLSSGYLTWPGAGANQFWFFHYPNFAPSVLYEAEATKWPITIGEELTGGLIAAPATEYTGPVLILTGQFDIIFCGGDCTGVLEPAKKFFPKASVFETYRQPDTGHGINLHYNATGAYNVMTDFIKENV